ncbi:MAG: hypothetical protein WC956_02105 [bacterium]
MKKLSLVMGILIVLFGSAFGADAAQKELSRPAGIAPPTAAQPSSTVTIKSVYPQKPVYRQLACGVKAMKEAPIEELLIINISGVPSLYRGTILVQPKNLVSISSGAIASKDTASTTDTHIYGVKSDGNIAHWVFVSPLANIADTTESFNVVDVGGKASKVATSIWSDDAYIVFTDGIVKILGSDNSIKPITVPDLPPGIVDVARGKTHTLVLATDGSVWAWGENHKGELGVPPNPFVPGSTGVAYEVADLPPNIKGVVAGMDTSFALTEDGHVWSWGSNEMDGLGYRCPADKHDQNDALVCAPGTGTIGLRN